MSETVAASAPAATPAIAASADYPQGSPAELRRRQLAAVLRLEVKKSFLGRYALWLYLLALAPVGIAALVTVVTFVVGHATSVGNTTFFYAAMYQGFLLRVVIFLACVAVFGNLIRREMLDRSLHFYFLTPVRRDLMLLGKVLAGLLATVVLFSAATVTSFLLAYLSQGAEVVRFLVRDGGFGHLAAYVLVTALACLGYGAVFLALGFLFKSPALPALGVFLWEGLYPFLPPILKQLTVINYLRALCPVPISPPGGFAILVAPPSPWIAVPGLLLLAAALLAFSAWRIRALEISYEDY